jgi:HSP20 family molecular chaperone IbpA
MIAAAAIMTQSRLVTRVGTSAAAYASASALSLQSLATAAITHLTGRRLSMYMLRSAGISTVSAVKAEENQHPLPSTANPMATGIGARAANKAMMTGDRLGSRLQVLRSQLHHHHRLVDVLSALFPISNSFTPAPMEMSLYVSSSATAYTVQASMPGMHKSDFNITVDDGVLRIEAERSEKRFEDVPQLSAPSAASPPLPAGQGTTATTTSAKTETVPDKDKDPGKIEAKRPQQEGTAAADGEDSPGHAALNDDVTIHYGESFYGRVERSLELPEDANVTAMIAKYRDGVLEVIVPRQQRDSTTGRKVLVQ